MNNLLKVVDYKSKEPFILIHDNKLLEDYKIIIETIKGKFITVDYLSFLIESSDNEYEILAINNE